MSDKAMDKYNEDPRTACRYGDKCYQKNSAHLSKYKHPPKKTKRKFQTTFNQQKKIKLDNQQTEQISDSDADEKNNTKTDSKSNEIENIEQTETVTFSTSNEERETKYDEEDEPEITDPKAFIKSKFLVDFPDDFYDFWDFCQTINPNSPKHALKDVGLVLVGAFDVLAGKFKNVKKAPEEFLRHWRYYFDPPEFFTVIKKDNQTGYHIGYFFDSPDEPPTFLLSNYGTKDGVFTKMGDNLFAAVYIYLEEQKKQADPFKKIQINKIVNQLKTKAEELKLSLAPSTQKTKARELKVVTKTHNKIGLVVPYNKKTQLGYRDLAMEDNELMTLLTKLNNAHPDQKPKFLSDLQPVITYASIAIDECDFGTGVKLGWEILYHGIDSLNATISKFLCNSYKLLNKEAFAKIAEAHMKNRKKDSHLSIV